MGVKSGVVLDPVKVQVAKQKEIDSIARREVVELVRTSECKQGTHVKGGWVEDNEGDIVLSRFVSKHVAYDQRDDVSQTTPALLIFRLLLSIAVIAPIFCGSAVVLSVWHTSVAFFHAVMYEVYVHPPRDMVPPCWCWKLQKSMHGTRRASRLWADYARRVMEDDGSETIAVFSMVFVNRSKRYTVAVWSGDFAFTVASEMTNREVWSSAFSVHPLLICRDSHSAQKKHVCVTNCRLHLATDPDDEEYKDILRNARRKLERHMAPAMPCKRPPNSITNVTARPKIASEKNSKTVNGCVVESHDSTWQRVESCQPKKHEDHIAGKGRTSMSHFNLLGTQVHSNATSDENSGCKSRSGQRMEKARDDPSMEFETQNGGYSGSKKRQIESPLGHIDGHMSPQKCGVGTKNTEVQKAESCSGWTL